MIFVAYLSDLGKSQKVVRLTVSAAPALEIPKNAILIHLEALNFDFYEFLHFLMTETYQMKKILSP